MSWNYLERDAVPVDELLKTSPQVYANGVRLSLLDTHGGVWADATTWCRTPLSEWVTPMPAEFFAFSLSGPDRMMANWFLASEAGTHVVKALASEYLGIFRRLGPLTLLSHSAVQDALAHAENTDVLVEPLMMGRRRDYPYFLSTTCLPSSTGGTASSDRGMRLQRSALMPAMWRNGSICARPPQTSRNSGCGRRIRTCTNSSGASTASSPALSCTTS